jgi:hypothetical protein
VSDAPSRTAIAQLGQQSTLCGERLRNTIRLPAIILRRNFPATLRMDEGADGGSRPREFRMIDDFNTPKPA